MISIEVIGEYECALACEIITLSVRTIFGSDEHFEHVHLSCNLSGP